MDTLSQKKVQVNVRLTEKEYVWASLYLMKKGILIAYAGLFFILVVAFYLLSFGETNGSSLLIAVVITLVTLGLAFYRTIRLYKKNFHKDKFSQETETFEIGEKGIQIFHSRGSVSMAWDDYLRIVKFRGLYLLYIAETKAHTIPERCFQSNKNKQSFEEIVSKHKIPM